MYNVDPAATIIFWLTFALSLPLCCIAALGLLGKSQDTSCTTKAPEESPVETEPSPTGQTSPISMPHYPGHFNPDLHLGMLYGKLTRKLDEVYSQHSSTDNGQDHTDGSHDV